MTDLKRKKNNLILFLILNFFFFNISYLIAAETKCKKFDIKCKTKNFIEESKEYQKKGIKDSKEQLKKKKNR